MSPKNPEKESSIASDIQEKENEQSQINLPEENKPVIEYTRIEPNRVKLILFIVTFAGFLGPLSGNIYIPILPTLSQTFSTSTETINGTVSIFMGIFSIGPLFWASWADFSGRKTLYLISLALFELSCILLASIPPHIASLFILRALQAFGGSSLMSVGAGTVADLVPPRNRGKAISYFMLGPQLGPIIGPILSVSAANNNWRWCFIIPAILGVIVYILILFGYPETLRSLVGDGECHAGESWIVKPKFKQERLVSGDPRYPPPPKPSLKGYWKLLQYKPVLLCSINAGLLFASFYALSVTFTEVLKSEYGFTQVQRSVSYICPGVSLICGSILSGIVSDRTRQKLEQKNYYIPEQRFSIQIFGLILSSGGLLGYGWGIEKHVHVSAIFIFMFLSGFGMTWVFTITTTYLTECNTGQPASNVAIGNFMRNAAAAISSAIIAVLVNAMGFGWCFTGLALLNVFGIGIVILLMSQGKNWREKYDMTKGNSK